MGGTHGLATAVTPRQRLARIAFDRGGVIALVVLVTYVWLAPDHIVDGDNAEFSTLGTLGGVAHPTGYPLYLLWLRAMSWLPGHSAAHTASIATAILAAASILVLHAACRAWGARPLAATLAVAIFAAGPVVLRMTVEAEAFAMNDLVAGTILWLAARGGPVRGVWRAGALGLVAGLGLSDHVTCVLLAPVGILGAVRGAREARSALAAIALGAVGLVVGLLPYAYLAITAENPLSWGQHIDGLGAVVHHFLREDYGGPGAFAPDPAAASKLENVVALVRTLGRAWLWLPLVLALVALGHRVARSREDDAAGETRVAWGALAASFLLAGPLLVLRFDVTLAGPGLILVQRFFVLPALTLAIPCAIAFDHVGSLAGARLGARRHLFDGLAVALFVAIAATSLPYVQDAHSPAVEQGVRNMLRSLPDNAVAIVHDDDLDFGSGYVQLVLGERRDVTVVMWSAIGLPAYRERIEQRLGITFPPGGAAGREAWFVNAVLARGRTVFADPLQFTILGAFPSYPHGILFRVLPRGAAVPSAEDVFALNRELFGKLSFPYALPSAEADWPIHVHERYARMWQVIRDELAAAGHADDAATAAAMAASFLPASYVNPAH